MKKLLMVLALVGVSFSANAQDDPTLKYSVDTEIQCGHQLILEQLVHSSRSPVECLVFR